MILYDPALTMRHHDYGIMLPISVSRTKQVLAFLEENFVQGTRGATMPFPGPVFDLAAALSYLGEKPAGVSAAGFPLAVNREDLERVHSKDYIAALYGDLEKSAGAGGLERALLIAYELIDAQGRPHRYEPEKAVKPLSALFDTILGQMSGTYLSCRLALAPGPGFCYFLGGGNHHARYDAGSGFCLINDVAIAAAKVLAKTPARLVWVIDLDAHKGDGTAELVSFARERGDLAAPAAFVKDPGGSGCVLSLSVHMASGWPLDKESLAAARPGRAPLLPSDVDIGIEPGAEAEYTPRLMDGIRELERLSGRTRPDLVLVVDGADPYEHDGLPSTAVLKLTLDQCLQRDNAVYRYVIERNIPSAWIQAGGYGERAWEPSAHFLRGIR